ncbi:MAG: putative DNA-binding domain-containing protein [Gammaproteobacteria bacterium]|nr:putative DNA-binding domain-containing protein [Gammaproteobacteria bacterium]
MPSLPELQRSFADCVYADTSAAFSRHIKSGRFNAEQHLQIYRNNVYASLTEALRAVFPVIARLVGDDCFSGCAYHYIRRSPPHSGNLHDFGVDFADFLSAFEPVSMLVYLADVARLEWHWHCAFHAADADTLALDTLAHIARERYGAVHFALHPSARLLTSSYPLLQIWQTNQPEATPAPIDLDRGGRPLLIIRRGLSVEIETLSNGEHALLQAFADDLAFAPAAEMALAIQPDLALAQTLRLRVADQTIVRFNTYNDSSEEIA